MDMRIILRLTARDFAKKVKEVTAKKDLNG